MDVGRRCFGALALAVSLGACGGTAASSGTASDAGAGDDASADAAASDAPSTVDAATGMTGVVYLTIVTHAEDQTTYRTNADYFKRNRATLISLANEVAARGGTWNLQSDWTWLTAVGELDKGEDTNGQNIVQWLTAHGVEVDPHAHESGAYNYADVAHLIDVLGVPSSGIAGGFLFLTSQGANWDRFRSPLAGKTFTTASWSVQAMWGAGTKNHASGDDDAAGIWRPRDLDHFIEDDPNQSLLYVGNCGSNTAQVRTLIADLENGTAPAGGFYTAAVFDNMGDLMDSDVKALAAFVDEMKPYVASGRVRWSTLSNTIAAWRSAGSHASRWDCR